MTDQSIRKPRPGKAKPRVSRKLHLNSIAGAVKFNTARAGRKPSLPTLSFLNKKDDEAHD